jgi:hypothetical protein
MSPSTARRAAAALLLLLQLACCLPAARAARTLQQANVWLPGIVRVNVDAKGNTNVALGPGGLFKINGKGALPLAALSAGGVRYPPPCSGRASAS